MRRKPKPDVSTDTQALDRRAAELLLSARGYTLQTAYQQAMREMDEAKAEKAGDDELFVGQ